MKTSSVSSYISKAVRRFGSQKAMQIRQRGSRANYYSLLKVLCGALLSPAEDTAVVMCHQFLSHWCKMETVWTQGDKVAATSVINWSSLYLVLL